MIQTLELVIKEHPFFHGLSDEHLDFITGCAKTSSSPRNTLYAQKAIRPMNSISSARVRFPPNSWCKTRP